MRSKRIEKQPGKLVLLNKEGVDRISTKKKEKEEKTERSRIDTKRTRTQSNRCVMREGERKGRGV